MNIYLKKIEEIAKDMPEIKIMEVCGGHTNTIMRNGIREILPKNIKLISGPGCPVCVTSHYDIDCMIALAKNKIPITTYGDMLRVPGSTGDSLESIRAKEKNANIVTVYSANEALNYPDHIFFGIGFETTTPMTAFLLKKGITVYSTHKLMPPPMKIIASGELKVDGFIDPGHVSIITGSNMWSELNIPQVICGFKPDQMIRAIYKLLVLIKENKNTNSTNEKRNLVINDYPEAVTPKGNEIAQKLINEQMKIVDCNWRGFGIIPNSGLDPKDDKLNAKIKYADILKKVDSKEIKGCFCAKIIKGLAEPTDCKLFKKVCTPNTPVGACMVSEEGSCAIYFKYGDRKK
ncbi:MAG: hydrogenase formation protein HypD [Candidatus Woesearchaeota archaeon]|jgi:hydrogenase expression/formation protein HypD